MADTNEVYKQLCYLLDSPNLGISPFYTFLESDSFYEVKEKMKGITCFIFFENDILQMDEKLKLENMISIFESALEFAKIRYVCLEDKSPLYIHKFESKEKKIYYAFVYPYVIKKKDLLNDFDYICLKLKDNSIVCSNEHFVHDKNHIYEEQILKYMNTIFESV